jgi:hypothetical protein
MNEGWSGTEAAFVSRASEAVARLAGLEISGLSQRDLMDAHAEVARLGRLTDTLLARFAAEVARRSVRDQPGGGLARQQGFGDAGAMIARVTGGSKASARRAIEAGWALQPADSVAPEAGELPAPRYPAVAGASLTGDLSVDAAAIITSGLESVTDRVPSLALHELERRLVEKAQGLAAYDVRKLVAAVIARADQRGHRERERLQYQERYVAWSEDHKGMVTFSARLDPVTAAPIRSAIEQIVTAQFRARRDQDPSDPDKRTVGQMRADALFDLCQHALGCRETESSGVKTTIVVRMTKADLESGDGLGCIDGVATPVSVGEMRRLAGDAEIVPHVLGGASETLDLGRAVRFFSRAQRLALIERDGGCAKCHAPPEHCEAHHIRWWEQGGRSDISNGVMLCARCHHDIHRQGWEIVVSGGRVRFVPPLPIDPSRKPRPGGVAALDIGNFDPVLACLDDDAIGEFFADDEPAVRRWEREYSLA